MFGFRVPVTVSGRRRIALSGAAALALLAGPHAVLAQQAAPPAAAPAGSPAESSAPPPPSSPPSSASSSATLLNEVVVTGSSIRGVAPTGSQLVAVSQQTIQAEAPANTKELLSTLPALGNFGANAEQSTSNRFRTPGFDANIHNLGIYATLVLFNGHRMAPTGGEAVFPDPSVIPVIALQRVEVIADGASSVYGSDAVAGVVNFIYRTNVEGVEISGTHGWNGDHYAKDVASMIAGHRWGSGSAMIAYEYSDNTSPRYEDIDFLRSQDFRSVGGSDLRATSCLQPNVTIGSTTYAYPGGVGKNLCTTTGPQDIIPDGYRHSILFTANQKLGDRVKLWTEVNWSKYITQQIGSRQTLNMTLNNTNPYFWLPAGVSATSETVVRSALGLFPYTVNDQSAELSAVTLGADVDLGRGWKGTVSTHYSRTSDYNSNPDLNLAAMNAAAAGTTPATALNPFGQAADNSAAVLAAINPGSSQINRAHQVLREFSGKADGPVWTLPGGDLRAAVGVDYRIDELHQLQSGGVPGPNQLTVRDDNLSRSVAAAYFELNVPVVSPKNAVPFIHRLTLDISGREDVYEKLGAVFNPKFGGVWAPADFISFHGSWGTSFAAPNMGLTTHIFGVPQPFTNVAGVGTVNIYNLGGGNPNLTPEKATTYSVGGDFTPHWKYLDGLRFSSSYYYVVYTNNIYKPTQADVFFNPAFAAYITRNPTAAQIAAAVAAAPPQSLITTGFDDLFISYAINLGVRRIGGFDFDAAYPLRTRFGTFNLTTNANLQTEYAQQVLPGTPFNSRLGTSDAPEWKARFGVNWDAGPYSATAFTNLTGAYHNTTIKPQQSVDAWTTVDMTLAYQLPEHWIKRTQLQFRVTNLFDADPPFYKNSTTGYYAALASPFGRTMEVTTRMTF